MTGAALTQKVEEGINWFERNLVAEDQQEKLEIRDFQLRRRSRGGSRLDFEPESSPIQAQVEPEL